MNRSISRVLVILILSVLIGAAFLYYAIDVLRVEAPVRVYRMSVLVRGRNRDSWDSIKQGAEQAADEMNVELSFVTLSEENSAEQQEMLLRREIESGAEAIVLAAADSEKLGETVTEVGDSTPVVCIESTVKSSNMTGFVSADNYAMGRALGEEMLRSGNVRKRLAVVEWGLASNAIEERRKGLYSVLEPIGGEVQVWRLPADGEAAQGYLAEQLSYGRADVIATLDTYGLEMTAQALQATGQTTLTLFGIGVNAKIATYLEQEVVAATVAQNDFAIGYLGVKAAVDKLSGKVVSQQTVVEHMLVNGENMYDKETQRLLFPFVR